MAKASHNQESSGQDDPVDDMDEAQAECPGTDEKTAGQGIVELRKVLDETKAQAADNWDKFMRSQAEVDNIRKRARRDLGNAHKYALESFIKELLPVWDSLEMGLDHAEGETVDAVKLREGGELTLRMLAQAMEKFNVVRIDPKGEVFDPVMHDAMTTVPSDEVDENSVLEVVQKGYALNGRLLRPARVIVAKAPDDGS